MTDDRKLTLESAARVAFPTRDEFRAAAALCTADEWHEYFDSWIEVTEQRGWAAAVAALRDADRYRAWAQSQRTVGAYVGLGWENAADYLEALAAADAQTTNQDQEHAGESR